MTCHSCGGKIGVDCFNPSECGHIAQQQEAQQQRDIQDSLQHSEHLQETIALLEHHVQALYKRVADLEKHLGIQP
jgi:polyhydroxyalkanoate synthesis regulator phasin